MDTRIPARSLFPPRVRAILAGMRVHPDLTSGPQGRGGEQSPTVPADPGGNEFCVIRPKAMLIR